MKKQSVVDQIIERAKQNMKTTRANPEYVTRKKNPKGLGELISSQIADPEFYALKQKTLEIECGQKKGAANSAQTKNKIISKAKILWEQNGKIRTMDEANRLKIELENMGHKRSVKTIYDWICMW